MTIEKLARFIVDDWYDGCPADETYQIALNKERKRLSTDAYCENGAVLYVPVRITIGDFEYENQTS